MQQVAAGGVQYALGLAGGAGGIENEQRVLGVHGLGRTIAALAIDQSREYQTSRAFCPVTVSAGALDYQAGMDIGAGFQCFVRVDFQGTERPPRTPSSAVITVWQSESKDAIL